MTVIHLSSSEHLYIWHVPRQKVWEAVQVPLSIEAQEKASFHSHDSHAQNRLWELIMFGNL